MIVHFMCSFPILMAVMKADRGREAAFPFLNTVREQQRGLQVHGLVKVYQGVH